MNIRTSTFLTTLLVSAVAFAQSAPSDSLFNTDQVVTVELDFGDPDFWNTLTTNFENDLGETVIADVTITDQLGSRMYYNVEVDLKGNSSYAHPGNKKSFKIDFNDNIQGQKYHGLAKVHFNNCFDDPTFLREKLFFDECRAQDVLAPRVLFANVSMNGTYWGFYTLIEPVDKDFLDRWADDNNGNLFKAGDNLTGAGGEADLAYYGEAQSAYEPRYELKTNENENDWSDLMELVRVIDQSTDAELAVQMPERMAWDSLLRSLALDNLYGNLDSYISSARNYYLYHDSTTFKWNWIKWDANAAFGNHHVDGLDATTLPPIYTAANRPLMERIMTVPELRAQYINAYCTVREHFTNSYLDGRIDELAALIAPHVANDPNKQFTTEQFQTNLVDDIGVGNGGVQVIRGLKAFVASRSTFVASALDCTTAVGEERHVPELVLFPVPAEDAVTVRGPEGLSLRGATLTDAMGRSIPVDVTGSVVDLSRLPSGVFALTIVTPAGPVTGRLVKR